MPKGRTPECSNARRNQNGARTDASSGTQADAVRQPQRRQGSKPVQGRPEGDPRALPHDRLPGQAFPHVSGQRRRCWSRSQGRKLQRRLEHRPGPKGGMRMIEGCELCGRTWASSGPPSVPTPGRKSSRALRAARRGPASETGTRGTGNAPGKRGTARGMPGAEAPRPAAGGADLEGAPDRASPSPRRPDTAQEDPRRQRIRRIEEVTTKW